MNRELLEEAYAIIDGVPEDRIDLGAWQSGEDRASNTAEITCGTIACAAGWLALHPGMNSRGLHPVYRGMPAFNGSDGYDALARFFGIEILQSIDLFYPNYDGESDKQVFLRRLRHLLNGGEA